MRCNRPKGFKIPNKGEGLVAIKTGRRKRAVATVWLCLDGRSGMVVNDRVLEEYAPYYVYRKLILLPLSFVKEGSDMFLFVRVHGGGLNAQSEAIALAISKTLSVFNDSEEFNKELHDANMLTSDGRKRERKKPGKRGARATRQFSKR